MADNARRRYVLVAVLVLILIVALLLLVTRCRPTTPAVPEGPSGTAPASEDTGAPPAETAGAQPDEVLTPATLSPPDRVPAGAAFSVGWTGPNNRGDFITIVGREASTDASGDYRETQHGTPLELTAPIEPGGYEVRYITGRSRTVLSRVAVEVTPVGASLETVDEVVLGKPFSVLWTGPANAGDYITIVPRGAADDQYGSYTETAAGSPLTLTAPTDPGDAEVRYVSGQGRKVLARRPIRVVGADVTLDAPGEAVAGTTIEVAWTGPANAGDYVTVVPAETPDGQYGNYTDVSSGTPLKLLTPIMDGPAELRYMTGQGRRVLGRRAIRIAAAPVLLSGPGECAPGTDVEVQWTGPDNPGDYITIVPRETPDGQYRQYANTSAGSPARVKAPSEPGEAEIRYMTGQGNKVLARIPIRVVP